MEPQSGGRLSRTPKAVAKRHPGWTYALGLFGWFIFCWLLVLLDWDENVGVCLRVACSVAAWAFVFRFSRVEWQSTDEGRHIMGYTLITAIFMSLATIVTIFGRFEGIEVVTIGLYGWLLGLLWQQHRLFTEGQAEGRLQKEIT